MDASTSSTSEREAAYEFLVCRQNDDSSKSESDGFILLMDSTSSTSEREMGMMTLPRVRVMTSFF